MRKKLVCKRHQWRKLGINARAISVSIEAKTPPYFIMAIFCEICGKIKYKCI